MVTSNNDFKWRYIITSASHEHMANADISKHQFIDKTVIVNDEFHELYAGGSFIIGQEQDGDQYGGFFDAAQSFSGKLAQVEMWNTELTLVDIFNLGNAFDIHFIESNN